MQRTGVVTRSIPRLKSRKGNEKTALDKVTKKIYNSLDELQADLDHRINQYNTIPTDSGKYS